MHIFKTLFVASLTYMAACGVPALSETTTSEKVTVFVPANDAISGMFGQMSGLFVEMSPRGRFISVVVSGYRPEACEGTYVTTATTVILKYESCGDLELNEKTKEHYMIEDSKFKLTASLTHEIIFQEAKFPYTLNYSIMDKIRISRTAEETHSRDGIVRVVPGNLMKAVAEVQAIYNVR